MLNAQIILIFIETLLQVVNFMLQNNFLLPINAIGDRCLQNTLINLWMTMSTHTAHHSSLLPLFIRNSDVVKT